MQKPLNLKRLVLRLYNKNYEFTKLQLATFFLGSPLLFLFFYYFLALRINSWIYEFTSSLIVFLINFMFNLNSYAIIYPDHSIFPSIFIPTVGTLAITVNCIAGHIFAFIVGVGLLVPSSRHKSSKGEFLFRKFFALIIAIGGIYTLNLFRIIFLLYFTYSGIPFDTIHESLFFLSAVIGALYFFLILKKWLPELFISIYYLYRLTIQKLNRK
jgi:exosortase/archaeosortase family protein